MTRTIIIALAAVALVGCKENHTIVAGGPDDGTDVAAATHTPVALPPSIASSKSYRCKDNRLVYVNWMSDGSAHVKMKQDEVGTSVTPGTDLKGAPGGSTINYKGQDCKA